MLEIELFVCIELDLALNNLQWLICHKTKPNYLILCFIADYASGLNLENVTPTCSVSGEDESGVEEEWNPGEDEDEEEEEEDEEEGEEEEVVYPYSVQCVEEVVQDIPKSQGQFFICILYLLFVGSEKYPCPSII